MPKCAEAWLRQVETIHEGDHYGRPLFVPCGKCRDCRSYQRMQTAGQAVAEALDTRERFGIGHVFFATLTYANDNLPWTESTPVDLAESLPGFRTGELGHKGNMSEESLRFAQRIWLEKRHGLTDGDIARLEAGDYPSVPTLVPDHVRRWINTCRKMVGPVRFLVTGEYGSNPLEPLMNRPHYHAMLFGYDVYQMEQALSLWKHGYTSPTPNQAEGMRALRAQERSMINCRGAAAYVVKYALKPPGDVDNIAQLVRSSEFTRRSLKPGLGRHYLERHFVPWLNNVYAQALGYARYQSLSWEQHELMAIKHMLEASYQVRLAGQNYPMPRRAREHCLEKTAVEPAMLAAAERMMLETRSDVYESWLHHETDRQQMQEELHERKRASEEAELRREHFRARKASSGANRTTPKKIPGRTARVV